MSELHRTVDSWLREGRPEPMSPAVREHLDGCAPCRAALAEVEEVGGWFPDPPELLGPESVEAVRFRLLAEARARRDQSPPPSEVSRASWPRVAAVAAAVVLVAGAAALVLRLMSGHQEARGEAAPLAVVRPAPGAVVRQLESPPHEVYRLVDGSASFSVRKLAAGQTLRVIVGEDLIVVRGTRFRLQARSGRLEAVEVSEGLVSLLLGDSRELRLAAGQTWRRDPIAVARRAVADHGEEGDGAGLDAERVTPATEEVTRPAVPRRTRRPRAPAVVDSPAVRGPGLDQAFHEAWGMLRSGDPRAAAARFDELLRRPDLGERRADVLFWSARAHQDAGQSSVARERLGDIVRSHPGAWHAAEARSALGEASAADGGTR
ncbi:MAG: FecR domain-containing protein [Deltaproteobacteria bacterium]|nr:FecR domain-containing protein [Deltaproteobacteria bacterium]